jgi:hypothetical protein
MWKIDFSRSFARLKIRVRSWRNAALPSSEKRVGFCEHERLSGIVSALIVVIYIRHICKLWQSICTAWYQLRVRDEG